MLSFDVGSMKVGTYCHTLSGMRHLYNSLESKVVRLETGSLNDH